MIKINLLPQEMVGAKGGPANAAAPSTGTVLVAAVLLLLFGLNAALGIFVFMVHSNARAEAAKVRAEADAAKKELADTELRYNETRANIEQMEKLIAVAKALDPPDRLFWSEKLNMLPKLVPEGIYITGIAVEQEVKEVETAESIKARNDWQASKDPKKSTTPPPVIKDPVITQTLKMDVLSYVQDGTGPERMQQISQFYNNLTRSRITVPFDKKERLFVDGFQRVPSPSALNSLKVGGREVLSVTFTMRTKPVTITTRVEKK